MTERSANYLYLINSMLWLLTAVLWYVLWYFNPYTDRFEMPAPTVALFGIALFAQYCCFKKMPKALIFLSAVSAFPFGLYLLGTPGIFAWIGVTNILSLIVAIITRSTSDTELVPNGN